ncbi:MAG TPA: Uma2 family endonuclease [Segetibacter sp.]|jgi:Uma2 family endonuclease
MDHLLKDILDSPKLPDYVEELKTYLLEEEIKRNTFYKEVRDDEKAEFINGEIICHSPAKYKHTLIVGNLNYIFTKFVRRNKTGVVTSEKSLVKLRRNDFEPDICFFRKEISDTFHPDTMFFPVPDFVVEVLSSNTEKRDRGVKFVDYALNGVKEYWLVDADKQFVEQYLLDKESFILAEKVQHGTIRCEVLKGLEIPLNAIFDEDANEAFQNEL